MKIFFLGLITFLLTHSSAISQGLSPKEKAAFFASNAFSKSKYKREEKYGIVKEKSKVIHSTPVISNESTFYIGQYVDENQGTRLELKRETGNNIRAILSYPDSRKVTSDLVQIQDAYFKATLKMSDGKEEVWEGAFINKNDNETTAFGLGIILPNPIKKDDLTLNKLFFKKIVP
ncbi:hypothetical protein AHMF7605_11555 [Adhaeribacter arboris]|uniref:DUF4251 domain-containing protein n=1 Tax=Adhaeribacter arboris TaxID=2072846 RepID=A0A2T2YF23_9BACT|nr:hypothetical protein [Adhaeribacter arboris]PSR54107.1 hypothetical protein AHMF7605_11555 [Adhaeribacter arboris]